MSNPLVGSTVLIQITVTNPTTGALEDATVDLTIIDPSGNETEPTVTHASTGVYEYYLLLDEIGWFYAVWTVTSGEFTTVKECSVCAGESALVAV
jgi:hypothetical protein